jgi:hypothetical protein
VVLCDYHYLPAAGNGIDENHSAGAEYDVPTWTVNAHREIETIAAGAKGGRRKMIAKLRGDSAID